jgi:methylthioribose-1-phosphate isomerase
MKPARATRAPAHRWEMGSHGVRTIYIVDNAGGHLMQHGQVDMVITGTDRTTAPAMSATRSAPISRRWPPMTMACRFMCPALAHHRLDVSDGVREIPIEERDGREVTHIQGVLADGSHWRSADFARWTPAWQSGL